MMAEIVREVKSDGSGISPANIFADAESSSMPEQYEGWSKEDVKYFGKLMEGLDHQKSRIISILKLKELVNSHNDLAAANVRDLLRKVCDLIVDINDEVRKETLNLLSCLFFRVPVIQMGSNYTLIRTSILNAATHMDHNVEIDSLKLIDLVSDFYPLALCNSKSIFNSFLDIITCIKDMRSVWAAKKLLSTSSSEIPPKGWRVQILRSLSKFLDANINLLRDTNSDCPSNYSFDSNKYSLGIRRRFPIDPEYTNGVENDYFTYEDGVFLKEFINEVLKLLFDAWEEEIPSSYLNKAFWYPSKPDSDHIMIILQVMCSINKWIVLLCKKKLSEEFLIDFKKRYSVPIQLLLLPKFPYYIAPKKQCTEMQEKLSNLIVNLTICKICAMMVMGNLHMSPFKISVLPYLLATIDLKDLDYDNLRCLLKTLKLYLTNIESPSQLESHLERIFLLYQRTENINVRRYVGNFFASLVLDPFFYLRNESHALELFLGHLIEVFFTAVNEETIDDDFISMLKKMAVRGITAFIASLQTNVEALIALLLHKNESVQDISAFLITKIHNFTAETFYKLSTTLYDSASVFCKVKGIISMFNSRLCCDRNLGFRVEEYYSFLFNIVVVNDSDLHKTSAIFPMMQQLEPNNFFKYVIVPTTKWETHKNIVDTVMKTLSELPDKTCVCQCIQRLLKLFLSSTAEITTHAVHAIFHLYNMSADVEFEKADVDVSISNLILSSCMYETTLCKLDMSKENQLHYSLLGILPSVRKNTLELVTRFIEGMRSQTQADCIMYTKTVFHQLAIVINNPSLYMAVFYLISDLYYEQLSDAWVQEILMQASHINSH